LFQGRQARSAALVGLGFLLSACSHNLYMVGRTNGATGKTVLQTTPGHPSGDMTIAVGSKVYSGTWVFKNGGGVVGIAAVGGSAGSFLGSNSSGNGSMLLSAPDGATLRCGFDYDTLSATGLGVCQDSAGELYDLQIS